MSRLPIRLRLVAGFLVAMLLLLTAAGVFVYWRVEYALDRGLDNRLDAAREVIAPLVAPTGRVASPDIADATTAAWQVLSPEGAVLDSGGPAPQTSMVTTDDLARVGSGAATLDLGGFLLRRNDNYRVHLSRLPGTDDYLLVGVNRDARDEALRELLVQLTLAGLGSLVVAGVVGDRLARAALRPVERYRRRAEEIAAGAAGLRLEVPPGRDDEVTRLGHTLNDMLAALEGAVERERRFVDEASHELRTPLTLVRSRIDLARRRARTAAEHEAVLDELSIDVTRLTELAERLLELGTTQHETGAVSDVNRAVAAIAARRPPGAVGLELAPVSLLAGIDAHALERAVVNLVDNAFAHGRPPVTVRTSQVEDDLVLVEVEDHGTGMPQELLGTATQRFTRAAEARSRPGAGLGLALVEQVAAQTGGELRLCFGGAHAGHGTPSAYRCRHSEAMVASLLLPAAVRSPSPSGSAEP